MIYLLDLQLWVSSQIVFLSLKSPFNLLTLIILFSSSFFIGSFCHYVIAQHQTLIGTLSL